MKKKMGGWKEKHKSMEVEEAWDPEGSMFQRKEITFTDPRHKPSNPAPQLPSPLSPRLQPHQDPYNSLRSDLVLPTPLPDQ